MTMKSPLTRRDVLKVLGGSVAGILLTPVPWKLLDDTAIWTQTGPWVSKLPRGPHSVLPGVCTLCPAGCPVALDCVGGVPFRTRAAGESPLCTFGWAFHQAPYHPLRLRSPLHIAGGRSATPVTAPEILARVRELMNDPSVKIAVLDQRPGRTASLFHRRLLKAIPGGLYVVSPDNESFLFGGLSQLTEEPGAPVGLDVSRTRLVISLGVPLLENQGATGMIGRELRKAGARVVQVEAGSPRTGILADECLQIIPGSAPMLAAGLAAIILNDFSDPGRLAKFRHVMGERYTMNIRRLKPDDVARVTGIPVQNLLALAGIMASSGPGTAVLTGPMSGLRTQDDEIVAGSLNILLDSTGPRGCVRYAAPVPSQFQQRSLAPVTDLRSVPDGSLNILIVDASYPGAILGGAALRRKLIPGRSIMLVFSPTLTGFARAADYVVPTPEPLEVITESAEFAGWISPHFELMRSVLPCPEGVVDPVAFMGELFGSPETSEGLLRRRIAAIHASGRGSVGGHDGSEVRVSDLASPDDLQAILLEGGVWHERTASGRSIRTFQPLRREITVDRPEPPEGLVLIVGGTRSLADLPPIMTKLVQESGLVDSDATVRMAPAIASSLGVGDGDRVVLSFGGGEWTARVVRDSRLRPGVLQLSASPAPVALGVDALEFGPDLSEVFESDGRFGSVHHHVVVRRG